MADGLFRPADLVVILVDGVLQVIIFLGELAVVFARLFGQLVESLHGGVSFLLHRLQLDLCLGQFDLVFRRLCQHLAVLVVQGVDVLLVCLGLGVLLPSLSVPAQGLGGGF